MALTIAIFGMGRFGRALASALSEHGQPPVRVGGRGKSHDPGRDLVRDPDAFLDGLPAGSLIVLSVRDDSLPEVAAAFAALSATRTHRFVHSSGVSGLGAIRVLADTGAQTGVFHILQSLPPEGGQRRIAGSYAAIAGPPKLMKTLRELAALLDVTPVDLREDQWIPYHAAAVLASNALLGLLDTSRRILADAGIPDRQAAEMMLPLVRGTLENAQVHGLDEALTGPVVRGDAGTIARHLRILKGQSREAYIAVLRTVVQLAERSGRTTGERLAEIRKLLE